MSTTDVSLVSILSKACFKEKTELGSRLVLTFSGLNSSLFAFGCLSSGCGWMELKAVSANLDLLRHTDVVSVSLSAPIVYSVFIHIFIIVYSSNIFTLCFMTRIFAKATSPREG